MAKWNKGPISKAMAVMACFLFLQSHKTKPNHQKNLIFLTSKQKPRVSMIYPIGLRSVGGWGLIVAF